MTVHTNQRSAWLSSSNAVTYLWFVIACAVLMMVAGAFPLPRPFLAVSYYVPLHLILELSSIVVGFAVAATAWYGHKQTRSLRDLLICVTFLSTGIVDVIHTLSYKGMPDFFSANDTGTAAAYWLLARLIVGTGLLAACSVGARSKSGRWTPMAYFTATAVVIGAGVLLLVRNEPASGLMFFDPTAGGLTKLKIGLEYLVIIMYGCIFLCLTGRFGWDRRVAVLLRQALIIAVFAELAFTLYLSPYGYFNALGHVFKTAAYYLILNALFVSAVSKPYEQLASANEDLQVSYLREQEQAREIQQSVSRIGNALSSSLELDEALGQIASLVGGVLHADCAIAASSDQRMDHLNVAMHSRNDRGIALSQDTILKLSRNTITRREPIICDASGADSYGCDSGELGNVASLMSVPVVHAQSILGAISVFSDKPHAFGDTERRALEAFASHAAVAVDNALRYGLESHVASVLQNAILDCSMPSMDRYQIVHFYEPAVDGTMVGGDFFDVVELPNGKVALSIGDVSGKGVEAAVHTAMVKYTLRAHLKTSQSPAEIMSLVDRAVSDSSNGEMFITMFFGLLDTKTGEMAYVNAGHVPPVLVRDGAHSMLDSTGGILGLDCGLKFAEEKIVLSPGSMLFLYTDGISEARQDAELFGTERIAEILVGVHGMDAQSMVTRIRNAAVEFGGGELKDDAAILAVTCSAEPDAPDV